MELAPNDFLAAKSDPDSLWDYEENDYAKADRVYIEPCRHSDSVAGTCVHKRECPTFCREAPSPYPKAEEPQ